MSNTNTPSSSSVALSSDSTIEAILSDIPLFCEGIMGIGVFTFLFLTNQVTRLSVFLYGSSFLAFAAATLDLAQVLTRSPRNNTAQAVGAVAGFIYSREVFLSLSIVFLNLFFWILVARCPRGECVDKSNDLSTRRSQKPSMHSASWNRWGLIGTILKWTSLAASLTVPLLQMVWRLMPGQRRYCSIYVAESTIQTTVTAVFILKFVLNIYISPLDYWWYAFREYFIPITALFIGTGLGIGNLILFSFTETSLGRFLRAVEVYLLIVHSLYTTFQAFSAPCQTSSKLTNSLGTKPLAEKFAVTDTLPYAYAYKTQGLHKQFPLVTPRITPRINQVKSRVPQTSWISPRRNSALLIGNEHELLGRDSENLREEVVMVDSNEVREGDDPLGTVAVTVSAAMPQSRASSPDSAGMALTSNQPSGGRPFTAVSLSYYTMDQSSGDYRTSRLLNTNSSDLPKESELNPKFRIPDSDKPPDISPQGSITSIDELFRQQTELDKSIAALRLFSMQTDFPGMVSEPAEGAVSAVSPRSRNTLTSNKTESLSNRSDFSLSVFPAPPMVPVDEVATKYPSEGARQNEAQKASSTSKVQKENGKDPLIPASLASAVPLSSSSKDDRDPKFDSAATHFDVTSFIGDLSGPSRSSQIIMSPDNLFSDTEETPTTSTATVGATNGLRPMILASMILDSHSEPALSATYGVERKVIGPNSEPVVSLRPLLLGKGGPAMSPPQLPGTMVSLARRRKRGGTITSNTRRPVISSPRMADDGGEAAPGAFEIPRPAPLRRD